MELKLDLTNQEYQLALQLCKAAGVEETHENLQRILYGILTRHRIPVATPLGELEVWIDVPPVSLKEEPVQAGIAITPNVKDAEIIDLAYSKYDRKARTLDTWICEDVMDETPTRKFSITKENFKKAFSVYAESE